MNHVANQLIFKSVSVWKFFVLVLKFKDFVKITFKWGFAHFWRPYSYKQNLGPDYKTIFTNINRVTNSSISISFTAIIYSWKANRREHHSLSLKHPWASARGGRGAMAPPGFSHTLSKSSQISKILPCLVVNTGSILIGPPWKFFCRRPCKHRLILYDF